MPYSYAQVWQFDIEPPTLTKLPAHVASKFTRMRLYVVKKKTGEEKGHSEAEPLQPIGEAGAAGPTTDMRFKGDISWKSLLKTGDLRTKPVRIELRGFIGQPGLTGVLHQIFKTWELVAASRAPIDLAALVPPRGGGPASRTTSILMKMDEVIHQSEQGWESQQQQQQKGAAAAAAVGNEPAEGQQQQQQDSHRRAWSAELDLNIRASSVPSGRSAAYRAGVAATSVSTGGGELSATSTPPHSDEEEEEHLHGRTGHAEAAAGAAALAVGGGAGVALKGIGGLQPVPLTAGGGSSGGGGTAAGSSSALGSHPITDFSGSEGGSSLGSSPSKGQPLAPGAAATDRRAAGTPSRLADAAKRVAAGVAGAGVAGAATTAGIVGIAGSKLVDTGGRALDAWEQRSQQHLSALQSSAGAAAGGGGGGLQQAAHAYDISLAGSSSDKALPTTIKETAATVRGATASAFDRVTAAGAAARERAAAQLSPARATAGAGASIKRAASGAIGGGFMAAGTVAGVFASIALGVSLLTMAAIGWIAGTLGSLSATAVRALDWTIRRAAYYTSFPIHFASTLAFAAGRRQPLLTMRRLGSAVVNFVADVANKAKYLSIFFICLFLAVLILAYETVRDFFDLGVRWTAGVMRDAAGGGGDAAGGGPLTKLQPDHEDKKGESAWGPARLLARMRGQRAQEEKQLHQREAAEAEAAARAKTQGSARNWLVWAAKWGFITPAALGLAAGNMALDAVWRRDSGSAGGSQRRDDD